MCHVNGTRHDQSTDDKAKPLLGHDHTANFEMHSLNSENEQGELPEAQLRFNIAKTGAEKLACAVAWRDGTDPRLATNQHQQVDYHDAPVGYSRCDWRRWKLHRIQGRSLWHAVCSKSAGQ
jgi:hypothetical protein